MERIRRMNMKTAVLLGVCFYSLTILIHVLIISGVIPYTWVNGGRSESFDDQLPLSIVNLFIAIIGGLFTVIVGAKKPYKFKRGVTVICWFFVILWSLGFIQQLLGTPFEKLICSVILLLGVISSLRMAVEKR